MAHTAQEKVREIYYEEELSAAARAAFDDLMYNHVHNAGSAENPVIYDASAVTFGERDNILSLAKKYGFIGSVDGVNVIVGW